MHLARCIRCVIRFPQAAFRKWNGADFRPRRMNIWTCLILNRSIALKTLALCMHAVSIKKCKLDMAHIGEPHNVAYEQLIKYPQYIPSTHWAPLSCTLTASWPEYELKPDEPPGLLSANNASNQIAVKTHKLLSLNTHLGIEYSASTRSTVRFRIVSLASLSGSPGWRGISFCSRWKP